MANGKDRRIADVEQAPHLRVLHDALRDSASCRSQVAVHTLAAAAAPGLLGLVAGARTGRASGQGREFAVEPHPLFQMLQALVGGDGGMREFVQV